MKALNAEGMGWERWPDGHWTYYRVMRVSHIAHAEVRKDKGGWSWTRILNATGETETGTTRSLAEAKQQIEALYRAGRQVAQAAHEANLQRLADQGPPVATHEVVWHHEYPSAIRMAPARPLKSRPEYRLKRTWWQSWGTNIGFATLIITIALLANIGRGF